MVICLTQKHTHNNETIIEVWLWAYQGLFYYSLFLFEKVYNLIKLTKKKYLECLLDQCSLFTTEKELMCLPHKHTYIMALSFF